MWGLITEVLAVPWKVSDPTLGLIRLQWWMDELAAEVPLQHPLHRLVHAALRKMPHLQGPLSAFIEASAAWLAEPMSERTAKAWLTAAEVLPLAFATSAEGKHGTEGGGERLTALGRAWGCAMLLRRAPHLRRNGLPLLRDRTVAVNLLDKGRLALQAARQTQAGRIRIPRARLTLLHAFSLSPLWFKAVEQAYRTSGHKRAGIPFPPLVPPSQAARQWRLLRLRIAGRLV